MESTENETCDDYWDPSMSPYAYVPFAIWYSVIFVFGLVGNYLIIHVTLKNRSLQSVQNIFIMNLAASDIIVCLISLPITPIANVQKIWYFGSVLCHLIPWVQGISIFICTFSLGAIAVDRYVLVVRPHWRPLQRSSAINTTIVLWTLSIIVTLPYAYVMRIESYANICGSFCTENWESNAARKAYTLIVMVAQFVVPFLLMAFCYAAIFGKLKSRTKVKLKRLAERSLTLEQSTYAVSEKFNGADKHLLPKQGGSESTTTEAEACRFAALYQHDDMDKEKQRLLHRTRRTTAILACMVIMFALTWLPHNIVSLLLEYDSEDSLFYIGNYNLTYIVNMFTHSFAMTNIITNPLLYAWLNPTFRELLTKTFCKNKVKLSQKRRMMNSSEENRLRIPSNHNSSTQINNIEPPPPPAVAVPQQPLQAISSVTLSECVPLTTQTTAVPP